MTSSALAYLRSPLAIRARCEAIYEAGIAGSLAHFAIELGAMPAVIDKVIEVTRAAYPELRIPIVGRTAHFRAGGVDRVAALDAKLAGLSREERARAWIDLVVVSVLLDAGAGDTWKFRESGLTIGRSEGLAVASLRAFESGLFSADPARPLRVDSAALRALPPAKLAAAFQASPENPLAGSDGRIALVRALGDALAKSDRFVGGRPGGLVDHFGALGVIAIPAPEILHGLLEDLSAIWPGRIELDGENLGDVWRHPAAGGSGPTAGLVPFHKLSQWLTYSLYEPFERAGMTIEQAGALTGLPEYRNGGLLVDLGVLVPKHDRVRGEVHQVGDEIVVEWRALTVALLDRVADGVREKLGKPALQLPLACILEGTWAAGRAVAAGLRPDGGPPIRIHSDGTVF